MLRFMRRAGFEFICERLTRRLPGSTVTPAGPRLRNSAAKSNRSMQNLWRTTWRQERLKVPRVRYVSRPDPASAYQMPVKGQPCLSKL
jgi:hypothetical protein